MKRYWTLLIILSINTSFANTHSQTIYQYKNQYNITEFTDRADSEKILTQKFEIKTTSVEQQEAINQALEKLRVYNDDFNQRYYDNKKRQYETAKKNAEQKKRAQQAKAAQARENSKLTRRERRKHKAEAAHAREVSKLTRSERRKHLLRDNIRKKQGKKGHSY